MLVCVTFRMYGRSTLLVVGSSERVTVDRTVVTQPARLRETLARGCVVLDGSLSYTSTASFSREM